MIGKARFDEDLTRAANSPATDREERLLRFVEALRAEQVRASIIANAKGRRRGYLWRWLGLLLAVVTVTTGGVVAFLQAPAPTHVHLDAPPGSAVGTALVQPTPESVPPGQRAVPPNITQLEPPEGVAEGDARTDRPAEPAPVRPVPGVFSLSSTDPSVSAPAEPNAADLPSGAEATLPKAVAIAPPAGEGAKVSEPDTAKPVLWVYYPQGSSRAEANARSVSARMGSNVASVDFKAQTNLPNDAVIKFSEKKDHALARMIGKSLGDSGYRWKIENTSSSVGPHRNTIEVWLPLK